MTSPADPRTGRRGSLWPVVVAFLVAEAVTVTGAALGFRRHGYGMEALLWILPGLGVLAWAFHRLERWRGSEFPFYVDRVILILFFIPAVAIGDWLQEVLR